MPIQLPVIRKDRFLSNFATKYKVLERVGDFLAPPFSVQRRSDVYAQFTKASLRIYDDLAARGEESKELEIDFIEGSYKCKKRKLGIWIDEEDSTDMDANWQIDKVKTSWLLDAHRLSRENRILQIAKSQSIVTQNSTPSPKWSNVLGTPIKDIKAAMTIIKQNSTMVPNAIVMTLPAALAMTECTDWKTRFQYTTTGFDGGLWNAVTGLKNLGLEPMIAGAFGLTTPQGSASDPTAELLLGNDVILFYREATPTLETRTFMYSPYHLYNEAVMRIPMPWKSGYKIEVRSSIDELLVDSQCAYLFKDAI